MKLELTRRDIFLLKLTGCALIIFLTVWFIVLPSIRSSRDGAAELEKLEEELQVMRESAESAEWLSRLTEQKEKELKEISAVFYGQMESRQVDELLTGLALQAGLFPVSLSIDEPRREIPAVYPWHSGIREAPADGTERASGTDAAPGTDDTGTGEDAGEGADGTGEDTGEGADGTGEDTGEGADGTGENTGEGAGTDSAMPPVIYMQMTGATLVLRGSEEAIFAFIDSVADHYPAIRIRSMDRDRRVFLGPELEVLEETDVRFELDICMYGWSL